MEARQDTVQLLVRLSSVLGAYLRSRLVTSLRGGPASPITDVLTLTFYYLAIDLNYLLCFLYIETVRRFMTNSQSLS